MVGTHCLDEILSYIEIERLKDHVEAKDLTLGFQLGFDSYNTFD